MAAALLGILVAAQEQGRRFEQQPAIKFGELSPRQTSLASEVSFGILMEEFDHIDVLNSEIQTTSTHRGVQVESLSSVLLCDTSLKSQNSFDISRWIASHCMEEMKGIVLCHRSKY